MTTKANRFVGLDIADDNALGHVSGKTVFLDDASVSDDALQIFIVGSTVAAGKLTQLSLKKVSQFKGVEMVLQASDIPGVNTIGPLTNDEPVFAQEQVLYYGQPLFAVAAPTIEIAKAAAKLAVINYEAAQPIVSIEQAIAQKSKLSADVVLNRGRSTPAIKNAVNKFSGQLSIGSQDHFYLEGQISIAVPKAIDQLVVYSSSQNVFNLRESIIRSTKISDVIVESMPIGGSFGGKQTQCIQWAIICALVAHKTNRSAIIRLDRSSDMSMTGKRHEFAVDYEVGFDDKGIIQGIEITLFADCGCSPDLSELVNDYALLHVDNAYYLKNITITSKRYKTNTVTSTVARGGGKAQAVLIIERIIDEIASQLDIDPLKVRINNLYGDTTGRVTHYGMRVADESMLAIINELKKSATYPKRAKAISQFNLSSPIIKRGIALTPVKFGVSVGKINQSTQANARVEVEKNGIIQVQICGAEVGQGLFIKVTQVVAEVFQVDPSQIKINTSRTDVFTDILTATGTSSLYLNATAVQRAAEKVKQRLIEFAAKTYAQTVAKICFAPEGIKIGRKRVQFKTLVAQALAENMRLSAQDTYAAEKPIYDVKKNSGQPFGYFVYGAAVTEVAIDSLTGESKVLRVDILQDCGKSINSVIDVGQIEGGFIQGMGWMTMEELLWDSAGKLQTQDPLTYKIPVASDVPDQFNVRIWKHGKGDEHAIFNSKVVGELPLVLAISVYSAINQAVASIRSEHRALPNINVPATPQKILMAIQDY